MGSDSFDMESSKKKSGCQRWQVAVICSLLIAIGLGVGLGVGLSNQNTSSETVTPSSTTPMTSSTTSATVVTTPSGPGPWTDYRLPDYIIPSHYALTLHPNMSTDTYTGVNAMTISITQATDYVLVHVDAKLNVMMTQLQLMGDNGNYNDITIKSEFRVPEYEYYVIESSTKLEASEGYLLTMEFEGSLLGRVVGLYKSVYTLPDTGEVKAMVGSDMEPTDARKAYPCFDEPALKIRYTTTLIHEPDHVALSNMHEESNVTREDGLVATTFGMSVPMPTYLGCFAIGEFVYLEKRSEKNNIPLRIYVPPHQLDAGRADYALEVMKVEFDYYEDLFGMDYALPKCDMISIPDFGTGAMENWGLITYRETNLLWDSEESSTHNKQRVAAVVAHELVHQWFGNLVTMKWWDNIWLNEGFASYLEYFGERAAEPTWQIFDHFVIDDLQPVMDFDATVTSHPIVVPVTSPSEITSVFDSISYSKGATVLRYLNNVLGNETFFGGLRNYLWKHQFGNADEQELFEDIQEYIDANTSLAIDVAAIMNPWVHQMGFPVIDVAQDGTVTQSHFLRDPNANLSTRPDSVFDYKWTVSLTYITSQDSAVGEVAFDRTQDSISLPDLNLTEGDWLKLNPGETGYYRVDYDDTMWSTFSEQLINDHTVLTELDRSHLIDDAFNLAPAQLLTYPKALEMTKYLDNERSFFVWDAFDRGSYYIRKMLESTIIYEDFQGFYVTKVKPVADSLGWVVGNESHVDKRNRVLTLSLALAYGDDDALNNATDLFKEWINDAEFKLFPDTRQLVYRYGVINATTEQWEEMLQRYVDAQVASEQSNLLRGLTSTEDIVLLDRMLDNCWDVNVVKSQEFFSCITYISYKPMGNRMAWNWIQLHWEDLVERYEITDRNLGRLVPNIVENYNTELQLWEVENFFERYPEAGAGASGRLTAVDNIKTNIAWMEMNQDTIQNWLNEQ